MFTSINASNAQSSQSQPVLVISVLACVVIITMLTQAAFSENINNASLGIIMITVSISVIASLIALKKNFQRAD